MKALILGFTLLGLGACASAPFYDSTTARSLGKDNMAVAAGYQIYSGITGQFGYGVSEDFDVGAQAELGMFFNTYGLWVKYAVVNPIDDGFALSLMGNLGTSGDKSYYTGAGLGLSYKYRRIEPNLFVRYNYVDNNENYDFTMGNEKVDVPAEPFSYLYINPGVAFWFNERMALAFNLGFVITDQGEFLDDPDPGYGAVFQFGF